jgi:putative NIF3 family GTP cyclohydrolase 1 type 2
MATTNPVEDFIRHTLTSLGDNTFVRLVLYAGHYATETFGVKALSEHLSKKFGVPWAFIDHPTGL